MLFGSLEFLFLFLPLVVAGFYLLQVGGYGRLCTAWLTLASFVFYGWWNPVYVPLILLSIGVNFSLGGYLRRHVGGARAWLIVGLCFNLGLLGYYKYFNFFMDNLNWVLDGGFNVETIILPLAISFYTFQQITYLVDSHRGLTEPHTLLEYSLFVTFFPQLIAGPIVHHSEMLGQFRQLVDRPLLARNITIGASIFGIGLFKKVVVADGFAHFATPVFSAESFAVVFNNMDMTVGLFAYAFQLYFDFSGYSDMAIGLACLFGIKLPVNFFSPYRSRNIGEFWRMWHATLARFLREYVFANLGGFVRNRHRQRFNLFFTMFLSGIWHGAGWTFVIFGVLHGAAVVVQRIWRTDVTQPRKLAKRTDYQWAMQVLTFLFVVFTMIFFRADTLAIATKMITTMAQWQSLELSAVYAQALQSSNFVALLTLLGWQHWLTALCGLLLVLSLVACWVLPSTFQLFEREEVTLRQPHAGRPPVIGLLWQANARWAIFIGALYACSAFNLTEVSAFLYFQF